MEEKCLWGIIDELRDDVNAHIDAITDLNSLVDELQAEAIEQIKDNKRLKGLLDMDSSLNDAIIKDAELIRKLKAENKQLTQTIKYSNGNDGLYDEVVESNEYLEEQIKELKAELDDIKGENIDLINHADFIEQGKIKKVIDGFKAEIKELKNGSDVAYMEILHRSNDKLLAENKQLQNHVDKYGALKHDELKAELKSSRLSVLDGKKEIDRLMTQVNSNLGNSSSTHTHTIGKEIAEYMSHNDGCMGARIFLLPRHEFKHGEYNHTIYWDDGME